jgi:DNA-binding IclR family transcriptional regulator
MSRKQPSPAVVRALDILEAISQRPGGLTNANISRRLGIPKSSASAILQALQDRGYVSRHEDGGRYRLGFNVLALGGKVLEITEFHDLTLPSMRRLTERTDLTCRLAVLGRSAAVLIQTVIAQRHRGLDTLRSVGECVPLHSSSVGKAMLAWQPRPNLANLLRSIELSKSTHRTIRTVDGLVADLDLARKRSYALDIEEVRFGWRCVGAPVFDAFGNTIMAICLGGTLTDMPDDQVPSLAISVKEAAQSISRQITSERVHFASY